MKYTYKPEEPEPKLHIAELPKCVTGMLKRGNKPLRVLISKPK